MLKTDQSLSKEEALELYKALLLPRRIEERMLKLLRQGKISKWFSGIGQEAISVGIGRALHPEDYVLPMHRNLGIFTTRGIPLYRLFCQWLGRADGFTKGRDRSFHFGSLEHKIVGMISHLAAMMPVADGIGLSMQLKQKEAVAVSFCGDGSTSEGDFHEALNLAGVWQLPVIFVIENNGYGLSTPTREQYACKDLVDRAQGYGLQGFKIDGNDIFEVTETFKKARASALAGKPVMIEAVTFRMRGHEEASGTFYVPDEKFDHWEEKDPVALLEQWCREQGYLKGEAGRKKLIEEVDELFMGDLKRALEATPPTFDADVEHHSVLAPAPVSPTIHTNGTRSERRFVDAVQLGLKQAMDEDETVLVLGQDIAEYGGVFKVTEEFLERFGPERIRNTPIIESGAIGAAIGLALTGYKPVVEMQFADFISCGFNQIVNNLSKSHYRWTPPLNVTIRCPHGAGVQAGPFHSQSPESWFMTHPGLKILVPSTVEDAQNMVYSAIQDPNPVLIFEHKKLYRSLKAEVPDSAHYEPIGKARVARKGRDATIITYGAALHWALEEANRLEADENISLEIVDLRSLAPIDVATIRASVEKTHRVLLLQEHAQTMGPMSEISAWISEHCFESLDAPVMRCSSLDIPIPFSKVLEDGYLASSRFSNQLKQLLAF